MKESVDSVNSSLGYTYFCDVLGIALPYASLKSCKVNLNVSAQGALWFSLFDTDNRFKENINYMVYSIAKFTPASFNLHFHAIGTWK